MALFRGEPVFRNVDDEFMRPVDAEFAAAEKYNKAGFTTAIINERLWVFKEGSPELAAYKDTGLEPSISASLIGEGPEGMTLKAANAEVLTAFQAAQ